jgi:hypothetical protein
MADIKSTRLRFIKASSIDELIVFVESMPHKIEIKGMPQKVVGGWILFFNIPDTSKFISVDLT